MLSWASAPRHRGDRVDTHLCGILDDPVPRRKRDMVILGKRVSLTSFLNPLENGAVSVLQGGRGNPINPGAGMWTVVKSQLPIPGNLYL